MLRHVAILLGAVFLLVGGNTFAAGVFDNIEGQVTLDGQVVVDRDRFETGQSIRTGADSTAVLVFEDGQEIALSENSTLKIDDYKFSRRPSQSRSVMSLLKGGMRAITGLIGKRNRDAVIFKTPTVTTGIRGTTFMLAINPVTGVTYASCTSGSIMVASASGGVMTVAAGQTIAISASGSVSLVGSAAASSASSSGAFTQVATAQSSTITTSAGVTSGATSAGASTAAGASTSASVATGAANASPFVTTGVGTTAASTATVTATTGVVTSTAVAAAAVTNEVVQLVVEEEDTGTTATHSTPNH